MTSSMILGLAFITRKSIGRSAKNVTICSLLPDYQLPHLVLPLNLKWVRGQADAECRAPHEDILVYAAWRVRRPAGQCLN